MAEKKTAIRTLVPDKSGKTTKYVCKLIPVVESVAAGSKKYTILITSPKKILTIVSIPSTTNFSSVRQFLEEKVKTTKSVVFDNSNATTTVNVNIPQEQIPFSPLQSSRPSGPTDTFSPLISSTTTFADAEIYKNITDYRSVFLDSTKRETRYEENNNYITTWHSPTHSLRDIISDTIKSLKKSPLTTQTTNVFTNFAIVENIDFEEVFSLSQPIKNASSSKAAPSYDTILKKILDNGSHIEDQAFLLYNLEKFNTKNSNIPALKDENKLYKNLIRVDIDDIKESHFFINKLFNPPNVNKFMSASPLLLTALTPKIRLYKVVRNKPDAPNLENSGGSNSAFVSFLVPFEQYFSINDDKMLIREYGKSYGAGLKSITINDSSGPQSPTNVTVDMKLTFSSFDKIFDSYDIASEEDNGAVIMKNFKFKDLFTRDAAYVTESDGTAAQTKDDHSFRLKLVIGWSFDQKLLKRINFGSSDLTREDIKAIQSALQRTEYVYNLGHKNFNVNLEETGKVSVDISYVSSIEKTFGSRYASVIYEKVKKGDKEYAISHDQIIGNLDKLRSLEQSLDSIESDGREKLSKASGGKLDLSKEVKDQFEARRKKIIEAMAKNRFTLHENFLKTLFENSKIYSMTIDSNDIKDLKDFVKSEKNKFALAAQLGIISIQSQPTAEDLDKLEENLLVETIIKQKFKNVQIEKLNSKEKNETVSKTANDVFTKDLSPKNLDDKEFQLNIEIAKNQILSDKNKIVNFVYLGDILEYVFGCLNNETIPEFRTCVPVVGNFSYYDPVSKTRKIMNYCDMPIALDRFKKFLFDEFVRPQIQTMRLEDFITRLFNKIIFQVMDANVFGQQTKKSFGVLQTGQCSMRTMSDGGKEIEYITGKSYEDILERNGFIERTNLSSIKREFVGSDSQLTSTKSFDYFYMFGRTRDNLYGEVINLGDRDQYGIAGIEIGADKGMVKKVNFSKQNGLHLAESAYSSGHARTNSNPLFLAGVANADIEMFGNTFFRPGAMVYIDPSFILRSPSVTSTEAEEFGLGGFYNITKVNHELSPGKFMTKASAVFNHHNTGKNTPAITKEPIKTKPAYVSLIELDRALAEIDPSSRAKKIDKK